ncbi:MAG: hypothetical protein Q8P79_01150 [Nanoarchaeota archaeon]|nr:hypothetical protein [Nanoarchaeota archaeon]
MTKYKSKFFIFAILSVAIILSVMFVSAAGPDPVVLGKAGILLF